MSRYLERLAATARKPGGTIHPLVGSMYSPARVESPFPLVEEEAIVAPPRAAAVPTISDEPEQMGRFEPFLESERSASPVARGEARATDFLIERPKAGPRISETRPASGSAIYQFAPTAAHSTRSPERRLLPPEEPQPAEWQGSQQKPWSSITPQLSPHFRPVLEPHTEAKQRMDARASAQRAARRPMETAGDIEIHIGRIEVTAAPPPAPRPAPPQPRKSLDLGEYLKSGRRRPS